METIIRGAAVYLFVWLIFRVAGKRTLNEVTTFDFVLLLIISETTQQGMIDSDHSLTNAALLVMTLVGIDILFSLWKQRSKRVQKWMDGVPVVILEDGKLLEERMKSLRVDEDDILSAARETQGLERLEQIKYAVMECSGTISIVPRPGARQRV